jgi:hypothetical protein
MSDFAPQEERRKRGDFTKFRNLNDLPRAAGVPVEDLKKLVIKELADNALDVSGACRIGLLEDGGFWVEDDGPGIDGTSEEIADLFSFGRDLISSKQLRRPTRGALGNGLRVVPGYMRAMDGVITVYTSGRVLELVPQDDGSTRIESQRPDQRDGTRIELRLGRGEQFCSCDLVWAERACVFSGAPTYNGGSSPYWFDEDAFWELCQSSSGTARALVASLEGCRDPKTAGEVAAPWHGRPAASLTREEAGELLRAARNASKPCKPDRLGFVGRNHAGLPAGYAREVGEFSPKFGGGTLRAQLPFVVEVWAEISDSDSVKINVNRTPVAANVKSWRLKRKTDLAISGCGFSQPFTVGQKPVSLILNVQTPYMPIQSDGKVPDLMFMLNAIREAIQKAAKSANSRHLKSNPTERKRPETKIIRDVLDEAIAKASGDGVSRYSVRQLFYQVRPFIINELDKEPSYDNFAKIITEIESERGEDLPGIYRDTRGTLYHPHTRKEMSLGTLNVEGYKRPAWTFNKILYCEKEGFFQLLKDVQWPERHDCALVTSKGQPTRAARDVLDLMGESDEELTFFCIHDADAAGTIIYQSLQDETKARPARRVRIINLGLEPEEALNMGLAPEKMDLPKSGNRSVAAYVAPEWAEWLQTQRVELNAMTSPQFIQWLDSKMAQYDGAKLVPPGEVLKEQLTFATRKKVQDEITEQVLAAAGIEERTEKALANLNGDFSTAAQRIETHTYEVLAQDPVKPWTAPVDGIAAQLARRAITKS